MMLPEKGAPERLYGARGWKDLAGHGRVSEKEFLSGRKRATAKPRPGTRTALYMRVSTADQKPDLQSALRAEPLASLSIDQLPAASPPRGWSTPFRDPAPS